MNWWGKVIGGTLGFVLVGPIGALLGAAIGHSFDKGLTNLEAFSGGADQEGVQAAFFTTTFSIMGYIAKADGQVSREEIALAQQTMARMQLNAEQTDAAKNLFNQGKATDFNAEEVITAFANACGRRRNLVQMFVEIQIATALADGKLEDTERAVLFDIASLLKINRAQFERLLAMAVAQQRFYQQEGYSSSPSNAKLQLADAYEVLGVKNSCTDQELKKAYRRLMSQHHPDKLVSKGLPEEMMKLATEKTQQIKDAYDLIKQDRQNNRG